jgi:hypothetical protein
MVNSFLRLKKGVKQPEMDLKVPYGDCFCLSSFPHFTFNWLAKTSDCHIFELKSHRWPIDTPIHKGSEEATQREFALFYLLFICQWSVPTPFKRINEGDRHDR